MFPTKDKSESPTRKKLHTLELEPNSNERLEADAYLLLSSKYTDMIFTWLKLKLRFSNGSMEFYYVLIKV